MKNNPSYIFSADIIRSIAILGVVIIHTANAIYTRPDFFGGSTWWISIILDSLSRISIPLFIMLSGFFILGKNESFNKSLKRTFFRIIIPFVFGIIFYSWWGYGDFSLANINFSIILKIFKVDAYHFYFLAIMIGLYLMAPIIRSYLHKASLTSQDFFMKFLLVVGVIEVALQFIFRSCTLDNLFTIWIPYAGFFVAGFVLGNRRDSFKNSKLLIVYLLALGGTLGLNYLYYFLSLQKIILFIPAGGCLSHYFDHYLSLNVLAMSIPAFLILLNFKYEKIKNNLFIVNLVKSIASASFGIYIIHLFVSRVLEIQFRPYLALDFTSLPIQLYFVIKLFLVFVLSFLLTLFISKIPLLRSVLGFGK